MSNIVTHRGQVLRTERLSPQVIRVVFGGEGLREFAVGPYSDSYVKLVFGQPDVVYAEPFDVAEIRRTMPREQWPATRTYTVRTFDPVSLELTIDFVHHGDRGLAGPWAAAALPGDRLAFLGPGGAYAPDPTADWHLLVGDESALPAIAASVERLPQGAVARVLIEIGGPGEELKLEPPAGDVEVTWIDRREGRYGSALVEAVTSLTLPPGRGHAFVHGEANWVKELRRHLRHERGMTPEQLSISGYWRRGNDEDGWQAAKAEFNQRLLQEQESQD